MEVMKILHSSAAISANGMYRYEAQRIWDWDLPRLVVCMLNPSTADAEINDPTVLTLFHFGELWGFGGLHIVNDRAFRASRPEDMYLADEQHGPENRAYLIRACQYAAATSGKALVAWGNADAGKTFTEIALRKKIKLICLGTTQSGAPKHPMARGVHRIPRDQQPIEWSPN
jgi:hypothetical protein